MGVVHLGRLFYPGRTNDNTEWALLNGNPPIVLAGDTRLVTAVDLRHDPVFAEMQRTAPNLMIWPTEDLFEAMGMSPEGGQRFIFKHPLYNGCHVWFTPGVASLAFDFDASGKFLGVSLASVENQ